MAVKISTNGFLKIHRPLLEKFTITDMAELLATDESTIQFVDMGTFVLVVDSAPERTMNSVGSLYFRFPIFGNLLILSIKELHDDAVKQTSENMMYEIDDLEAGLIKSIQDVLTTYKAVMGEETDADAATSTQPFQLPQQQVVATAKNKRVFYYDPDNKDNTTDDEREFIDNFFKHAYDVIKEIKTPHVLDVVLFEDEEAIIKFMPGKVHKTLNLLLNRLIESEEYEKCTEITRVQQLVKDYTENDLDDAIQE